MTTVRLTLVKLLLGMMLACILPFSTWGSEANTQLTLSDAVTAALEKNPEIQLWRQRVQVASARAKQAPIWRILRLLSYLWEFHYQTPRALIGPIQTRSVSGRSCRFSGNLG